MTATAERNALRNERLITSRQAMSTLPPELQKAVRDTDPKTRKFILETVRLKEAGLLANIK